MIIKPKNPMFILATLAVPWQCFNTSIRINKRQIEFNRYFCTKGKLIRNTTDFMIDSVQKIGFPCDFMIKQQEESLNGLYGTYSPQEIVFILSDKKVVSLNARPYTKRQIKTMLKVFSTNIVYGKKFSRLFS